MLRINVVNVGTGILMVLSLFLGGTRVGASIVSDYGLPYLSVSVSLNILLTLIIVTRLVLHSRNIRAATGTPAGIGGLYKTIITMLIESCALYAVSSLLVIAPPGDDKYLADIFLPILAETQVRALSLPQLSIMMSDWIGHRSAAHHSTSRQQERVDKQHCRLRTYQFAQSWDPRGVDRW